MRTLFRRDFTRLLAISGPAALYANDGTVCATRTGKDP